MMNRLCVIWLLVSIFSLSCEDVIDVNLNDADPQLVVVGTVSNRSHEQQVTISRTVAFDVAQSYDPVSSAEVTVVDGDGRVFRYREASPGVYVSSFRGHEGERYELSVRVEGQAFTATSTMPQLVTADSIGTGVRTLFGEEQKFISLRYADPIGVPNYYRYLWRVNGGPLEMLRVSDDKFNDGKYVSEDLMDFDTDLVSGDSVTVWMQSIDIGAYDFWNAVESTNPGTAAPANPPSPFGDGALGYFSAYAESEMSTKVQ
ncbi:DUF4249 domain-containing protein [Parapedobacter sp. 10938]|uniref:DUF4249 domain-containing protein n=1 Tax=Parapedobacter flavus TaxID=3110225 RepID=UPI002DB9F233|nr:DUF4249 domain-containing protein [Parapedobacter sp. 10938]MEC3880965.1 DUF4249 domain-containing protein [Parapedobacter sp. 10938]